MRHDYSDPTVLGDLYGTLSAMRCDFSAHWNYNGDENGNAWLGVTILSSLSWNETRLLGEWLEDVGGDFRIGDGKVRFRLWFSNVTDADGALV